MDANVAAGVVEEKKRKREIVLPSAACTKGNGSVSDRQLKIQERRARLRAWKEKRAAPTAMDLSSSSRVYSSTAEAKIWERRSKLNAWKAKRAISSIKNETVTDAVNAAKWEAKKLMEKKKKVEDVDDPLEAIMAAHAAQAKLDIAEARKKELEEEKIVASGGRIVVNDSHIVQESLKDLVEANKRCYICKQYGHSKKDCPQRSRANFAKQ